MVLESPPLFVRRENELILDMTHTDTYNKIRSFLFFAGSKYWLANHWYMIFKMLVDKCGGGFSAETEGYVKKEERTML